MPYRKAARDMKLVGEAPGRHSEHWSARAIGPTGGGAKKGRTPNLAGFKELPGRERNEGSPYRRKLRWIKKDAQIKQALREKRGKP